MSCSCPTGRFRKPVVFGRRWEALTGGSLPAAKLNRYAHLMPCPLGCRLGIECFRNTAPDQSVLFPHNPCSFFFAYVNWVTPPRAAFESRIWLHFAWLLNQSQRLNLSELKNGGQKLGCSTARWVMSSTSQRRWNFPSQKSSGAGIWCSLSDLFESRRHPHHLENSSQTRVKLSFR